MVRPGLADGTNTTVTKFVLRSVNYPHNFLGQTANQVRLEGYQADATWRDDATFAWGKEP